MQYQQRTALRQSGSVHSLSCAGEIIWHTIRANKNLCAVQLIRRYDTVRFLRCYKCTSFLIIILLNIYFTNQTTILKLILCTRVLSQRREKNLH